MSTFWKYLSCTVIRPRRALTQLLADARRPVYASAMFLLMGVLYLSTPADFASAAKQNISSQDELLPPYSIRPPAGYEISAVYPAPLAEAFDMTFTPSGELLVIELGLPRIRKVTLEGEISTYALLPHNFSAIAYNAEGELFVGGGEILRVSPNGELTTFCETSVTKIVLGPDGAFYTIDWGGSPDVKKITPDGQVSTYATGLSHAADIDFSQSGELYVSDPGSQRIVKVGADGTLTTVATGFWKEPGIIAFNQEGQLFYWGVWGDERGWGGYGLYKVSVSDGSVTPFVMEFYWGATNDLEIDEHGNIFGVGPTLGVLFKISPDGRVEFLTEGWYNTRGLAVGPSGDLFIADQGSLSPLRPGQIVRVGMDGNYSVYADGLAAPRSLTFDSSGNLFVGDDEDGLLRITPDGEKQVAAEEFGLISIAFDPLSGDIFGLQHFFLPDRPTRLLRITSDGSVFSLPAAFKGAVWDGDLTVDSEGNVLLLVTYAENINLGPLSSELLKISPTGEVEILAEFTENVVSWTGSLAVGPSGDIYLVDQPGLGGPSQFVIWKVTPQGEVSLFADRLPSDPFSIAINPEGDIFFTCGIGIYRIFAVKEAIIIDGLKDDWEGASPIVVDPKGDSEGLITDIRAIYGFMDDQNLYLMVDFYQLVKDELDSINIEVDLNNDGQAEYVYVFLPDGVTVLFTDLRASEFSWHKRALSYVNEVAEIKLPLSYIENGNDFSWQVVVVGKSDGGNFPADRTAAMSMPTQTTPTPTPTPSPTTPALRISSWVVVVMVIVIVVVVGAAAYMLGKHGIASKEVNAMKHATAVKTTILVAVLVITNALLGVVCGRVYRQYEALFSPGPELLNLAIWVFGIIALVVMAAGLLVALVRPFWVIIVAFVLSALALILAWETSIVSVALGLVYLVLAIVYARSVVGELNDRLNFSVRPIKEGQEILVTALILLVSISFALGYREDAMRRGFIFPPAYKQTVEEIVFPRLQAQIESRSEIRPEEKAAALEKARQEFEQSLVGGETMLQPYAQFIWVGLAFMVSGILNFLQPLVSWVPSLVLSGIFPLLKLLGMTRVVTETREIKRLILS